MNEQLTVTRIEQSACASRFKVERNGSDGSVEYVRLWIITGGTPALALDDYSYTLRYPLVERFNNAHWLGDHYRHQELEVQRNRYGDRHHVISPAIDFDVLPHGLDDLAAFLDHTLPLRNKRDQRMAQLPPVHEIRSRRVHDTDNRTYAWAKIDIQPYGVSPITIESAQYGGRCDDKIVMFSQVWQDAQKALNPLFDRSASSTWESLSDDEFEQVRSTLWMLYTSGK